MNKVKARLGISISRLLSLQQKQQLQPKPDSLRHAVGMIVAAGFQLDKPAFEYLKLIGSDHDLTAIAQSIISDARRTQGGDKVITRQLVESVATGHLPESSAKPNIVESVSRPAPYAKQIEARMNVIRDPGAQIGSAATIEDFSQYFRDRYRKQRQILQERLDVRGATNLAQALAAGLNEKVKFVAMVMEKRERGRRVFLEVDDVEDTATVLVDGGDNRQLLEAAQRLPLDQVACFEATRARGDLLVAQSVILPDIPDRRPKGADEEVYAILLSDLHVGSKMFLPEAVQRVLDWMNLKIGTAQQRRIAERAKYVIICGDIVDGIGVYPRQEEELEIPDIYMQYQAAAKYIEQIPEHMELIVIPGNHDAARQAMPQPPIMKSVAEPFYSARTMYSLGNPAEVQLHGVSFLLHHGRSLDDVMATVPGMNFTNPAKAMEFQLKCRHLVPEYGKRTAIAPERVDHLVIETPPDVFQSGHIHVVQHSTYRGTQIVNSGAWQAQTDYQRRMGLTPTTGILPVINLQSLAVTMTNFRESFP